MLEEGTQPVYKPPLKDLHIPNHANATSIPTFFFFWTHFSCCTKVLHLVAVVRLFQEPCNKASHWKCCTLKDVNDVGPELDELSRRFMVPWRLLPALTPSWLTACHHRKILNCKLPKACSAGELIVSDCTLWGQIGASQVVKRRNSLEKENRSSLPAGLNPVPVPSHEEDMEALLI